MRFLALWMVGVLCLGFSGNLRAHQVDSVEMEFRVVDDEWWLVGLMDIAFMVPERRGDPEAPPYYRGEVMEAPSETLEMMRRETENTLRRILTLRYKGEEVPWRIAFPDFDREPFELPEDPGDWALLTTHLRMDARPGPGELQAVWNDDQGSELIIVIEEGENAGIISTPAGMSSVLMRVDEEGRVVAAGSSEVGWGWFVSGYRHVVPTGLDHLLFILGLFLLAPRWKPLLVQSLVFTIAHSITLALAVFGWVNLPERAVDIAVAASIAWIGIENLWTKELKPRRLILVFGFGLLHGLGFAGDLVEKLASVPAERLVQPLLWFNVGVEMAQITVLAVAFALLWPFRKHAQKVRVWGSAVVALAGVVWIVERVLE
jgi:hydrogenase/urease accessory protein HupE